MEITHDNHQKKGIFKAIIDGKEVGEMTYTWAGPTKFIIDHTEVNPEFKGQNIGEQLVLKSTAYANVNNIKIIPLCSFAKSVFDKNEDLKDVLF